MCIRDRYIAIIDVSTNVTASPWLKFADSVSERLVNLNTAFSFSFSPSIFLDISILTCFSVRWHSSLSQDALITPVSFLDALCYLFVGICYLQSFLIPIILSLFSRDTLCIHCQKYNSVDDRFRFWFYFLCHGLTTFNIRLPTFDVNIPYFAAFIIYICQST